MIFNLEHNPGRSFTSNGVEYLYFGGTSYLGLQTHPDFLKGYAENILKYGSSHGASRKICPAIKPEEHVKQASAPVKFGVRL